MLFFISFLKLETILGKPFDDIKQYYTLSKELSRGQFGVTYFCTENSSGNTYACKSILKRKLVTKNDKEDIKRDSDHAASDWAAKHCGIQGCL